MTQAVPSCSHCDDTGSTQKRMDADYLDCGRCDVATKRDEFDAWALVNLPADRDAALWLAYKKGRLDGFTESQLFG